MNNTKQCIDKNCACKGELQSVRNFRVDGHLHDGRRPKCKKCENRGKTETAREKARERDFYAQFSPI